MEGNIVLELEASNCCLEVLFGSRRHFEEIGSRTAFVLPRNDEPTRVY